MTSVLVNQNELLHRYPGTLGGKTGFTDLARKTFVGAAAAQRQAPGHRDDVRPGARGGPTYWDQAASLLDWGFALGPNAGVGQL